MAAPVLLPLAVLALVAAAAGGKKTRRRGCPEGFVQLPDGSCEVVFEDGETIYGGDYQPQPVVGMGTFGSYAELPAPIDEGQALIRWMLELLGLDPAWSMFFETVALNESNFNPLVGLGIPSRFPEWAQPNEGASFQKQQNEANAAERAYNRNKKTLKHCPWPKSRYTFGSGGLYALLPPNAVMQFRKTELVCIDPWAVFEWTAGTVMAIEMARGLTGWKNFRSLPVYGNLRIGWGNPSNMGKASSIKKSQTKDRGYADRLAELGYDPSLWYEPVQPLPPRDPVGMLNYLDSVI